jgi:hypothetical protein
MTRAIKAFLAAALIFGAWSYARPAQAADLCPDWWGTMPLTSYHFDRRRSNGERWNEANLGIGVECKAAKGLRLGGGYYPNSKKEDTFFLGVIATPWEWKRWEWGGSFMLGTGYSEKVLFSGLPTGAAVREFDGEWKGWGVTVLIATSAVALKLNRDF